MASFSFKTLPLSFLCYSRTQNPFTPLQASYHKKIHARYIWRVETAWSLIKRYFFSFIFQEPWSPKRIHHLDHKMNPKWITKRKTNRLHLWLPFGSFVLRKKRSLDSLMLTFFFSPKEMKNPQKLSSSFFWTTFNQFFFTLPLFSPFFYSRVLQSLGGQNRAPSSLLFLCSPENQWPKKRTPLIIFMPFYIAKGELSHVAVVRGPLEHGGHGWAVLYVVWLEEGRLACLQSDLHYSWSVGYWNGWSKQVDVGIRWSLATDRWTQDGGTLEQSKSFRREHGRFTVAWTWWQLEGVVDSQHGLSVLGHGLCRIPVHGS